jgi:hypothetical protein
MCNPKKERMLYKEDFIIPDDWEPTKPHVKRLVEMRNKIINTLGPDFVRELLEEVGVTPEGGLAREDSNRC